MGEPHSISHEVGEAVTANQAADGGARPVQPTAVETAAKTAALFKAWCTSRNFHRVKGIAPLVLGLQEAASDAAAAALFANVLLGDLHRYRRALWVNAVAEAPAPWGRYQDRDESPRRVFGIDESHLGENPPLQTARLFTSADLFQLLNLLEETQPERHAVFRPLLHAICDAISQAADSRKMQTGFTFLQNYYANTALPLAERNLKGQPPAPLRSLVRELFGLTRQEWGWGCLTFGDGPRLSMLWLRVAGDYLSPSDFEAFQAHRADLREWARTPEQKDDPRDLKWLLRKFQELAGFANVGLPVLAGPAAGPHRLWLRYLFENFSTLGRLAGYALDKAEIRFAPAAAEGPPPTAPAEERPPPDPGAPVEPDGGETELLDDLPEVSAAEDSQEPVTAAPPLSAIDVHYAEQAHKHLPLRQFEALAAGARGLCDVCRKEGWKEAVDALEALSARFKQFKELLPSKLPAVEQGDDPRLKPLLFDLSDELLGVLKKLDRVLPGWNENNERERPVRPQLSPKVQEIRDGVFDFMKEHGSYRMYEVRIGDSLTKHSQNLTTKGAVSSSVGRGCVARIAAPGYQQIRNGTPKVRQQPEVFIAR